MHYVFDSAITIEDRGYDAKVKHKVVVVDADVYHDEGYRVGQKGDVIGLSDDDYNYFINRGDVVDAD